MKYKARIESQDFTKEPKDSAYVFLRGRCGWIEFDIYQLSNFRSVIESFEVNNFNLVLNLENVLRKLASKFDENKIKSLKIQDKSGTLIILLPESNQHYRDIRDYVRMMTPILENSSYKLYVTQVPYDPIYNNL
ncbi:MAG: hypothetical protein KQA41_03725 [Candidatus Aenigmarchaeota archaeon]|nr:hypothetical protein [Candidatus Aenigmarchaeota archaeon]